MLVQLALHGFSQVGRPGTLPHSSSIDRSSVAGLPAIRACGKNFRHPRNNYDNLRIVGFSDDEMDDIYTSDIDTRVKTNHGAITCVYTSWTRSVSIQEGVNVFERDHLREYKSHHLKIENAIGALVRQTQSQSMTTIWYPEPQTAKTCRTVLRCHFPTTLSEESLCRMRGCTMDDCSIDGEQMFDVTGRNDREAVSTPSGRLKLAIIDGVLMHRPWVS